jgi:hypothetical protein
MENNEDENGKKMEEIKKRTKEGIQNPQRKRDYEAGGIEGNK